MSLGERLLELRKAKHLSQEEVAEKINVTRQSVSKWETDQSLPDFDKIIPLCNLYGISSDELLTGNKNESVDNESDNSANIKDVASIKEKRAKGIALGVFLYFAAIVSIMVLIPVFGVNPTLSVGIFLLICGAATGSIVYTCINYSYTKKLSTEEKKEKKLRDQIENVVSVFVLIIYLFISFTTGAWHITWLLWLAYGLFCEILKLFFMIRGENNGK